jgi:alpha-ribazole phosphatase/probable phosphoglycerate mutase
MGNEFALVQVGPARAPNHSLMKDLEIWWIRHGQSLWNRENRWQGHSDIPLSDQGQEQARRLGKALRSTPFDLVFSSDLQRARQTAGLALPGHRVVCDARLREVHFGEFEGLTLEEMSEEQRRILKDWLKDPFARRIPAGESLHDVLRRLQAWLAELPDRGRVAVFTHGGLIRCGLWTCGDKQANPWQLQIANCSSSCIRYGAESRIEWVNDLSGLDLP